MFQCVGEFHHQNGVALGLALGLVVQTLCGVAFHTTECRVQFLLCSSSSFLLVRTVTGIKWRPKDLGLRWSS